MNSSVCVDASLIIRTLVYGPLSEQATVLLAQWYQDEITLLAPALYAFEVTATLRRLVYLKEITAQEEEEAFARFLRIKVNLSHRQSIYPIAWALAKQLNRPRAYDTAYLAVAQLNQCDFWTADERLYNAVQAQLPWVKWVGHAPAPNGANPNQS